MPWDYPALPILIDFHLFANASRHDLKRASTLDLFLKTNLDATQ
jgi:hypothetical protein